MNIIEYFKIKILERKKKRKYNKKDICIESSKTILDNLKKYERK